MSLDTMAPATAFESADFQRTEFDQDEQTNQIIISGWYPDPTDADSLRRWDGAAWTTETKPRHATTGPTPVPASSGSTNFFPPVAIRTDASLPPVDPYRPRDKRDHDSYVPMASLSSNLRHVPTRTYTASVWWLATLPAWSTAVSVALIVGLGNFYTGFLQLFTALIVVFVAAAITIHDHKILLAENHQTAASAWWILLTPLAYLIARGAHVHRSMGRGWAPVVLYLVCSVVPAAAIIGVTFFLSYALALLR